VCQSDLKIDAATLEETVGEHHQTIPVFEDQAMLDRPVNCWTVKASNGRRWLPWRCFDVPSPLRRIGAGCPADDQMATPLTGSMSTQMMVANASGSCVAMKLLSFGDGLRRSETVEQVGA
jgi:hypothetical protein